MLNTIGKLERKADRWAKRGKPWRGKLVVGVSISIILGVPATVILAPVYGAMLLNCSSSWSESGREWRYRAFGGCQVKDKGGWIPEGNIRAVE